MALAAARDGHAAAKQLLATGTDPSHQKRLNKLVVAVNQANAFSVLANDPLDKKRREGKAPNTLFKLEWLFSLADAAIGARPISEISEPEVPLVLKSVEAKGRLETAKRSRALIGEVFRYATLRRMCCERRPAPHGLRTAPCAAWATALTT